MLRLFLILFLGMLAHPLFAQSVQQKVEVVGADGVVIHGTLTLPMLEQNETVPVVIIAPGRGPTDRNGNTLWMGNNSLRMVAENLAGRGIASIRYDKRGVGESTSVPFCHDTVTIHTHTQDARLWMGFVQRDARLDGITVLGHSEGAKIAMLLATEPDHLVSRLVLISTTGLPLDKTIQKRVEGMPPHLRLKLQSAANQIIDSLRCGHKVCRMPVTLNSLFGPYGQNALISYFKIEPTALMQKIEVPTLVLHGTTDIEIPVHEARVLVRANPEFATFKVVEGMNHVLKSADGKGRDEQHPAYSNPSLPLHPELIPAICNFIKQ